MWYFTTDVLSSINVQLSYLIEGLPLHINWTTSFLDYNHWYIQLLPKKQAPHLGFQASLRRGSSHLSNCLFVIHSHLLPLCSTYTDPASLWTHQAFFLLELCTGWACSLHPCGIQITYVYFLDVFLKCIFFTRAIPDYENWSCCLLF